MKVVLSIVLFFSILFSSKSSEIRHELLKQEFESLIDYPDKLKTAFSDKSRYENDLLLETALFSSLDDVMDNDIFLKNSLRSKSNIRKIIKNIDVSDLSLYGQIRILRLSHKLNNKLLSESEILNNISKNLIDTKLLRNEVFLLLSYKSFLLENYVDSSFFEKLEGIYPDVSVFAESKKTSEKVREGELQDLLGHEPRLDQFRGGRYQYAPRVFLLCRENRNHHCLMVIKNHRGEFERNSDGRVWTHKALAQSWRKKDFDESNGRTPSGVFLIDSVMPAADKKKTFGKYRRLILNFVRRSPNEFNILNLLPYSSQSSRWWKEGVVARDIGRFAFRIHGTGRKSVNSKKDWFPFVRTSGCIAQREGTYKNVKYTDQRILLDRLMHASGLSPSYSNESRIKGILYVINIDNSDSAVKPSEIEAFL